MSALVRGLLSQYEADDRARAGGEEDERARLATHLDELRRATAATKARIAELEGRPEEARFELICAGLAQGDLHGAYIELRAAQHEERGTFWEHETAEDRTEIEAAVERRRGARATVVVGEVAGIPVTVDS